MKNDNPSNTPDPLTYRILPSHTMNGSNPSTTPIIRIPRNQERKRIELKERNTGKIMTNLGCGEGACRTKAAVIALNGILKVLFGRHNRIFPQRALNLNVLVGLVKVPTLQC